MTNGRTAFIVTSLPVGAGPVRPASSGQPLTPGGAEDGDDLDNLFRAIGPAERSPAQGVHEALPRGGRAAMPSATTNRKPSTTARMASAYPTNCSAAPCSIAPTTV